MENRSFLTLEDTSREELREILDLAAAVAVGRIRDTLANNTIRLAFF